MKPPSRNTAAHGVGKQLELGSRPEGKTRSRFGGPKAIVGRLAVSSCQIRNNLLLAKGVRALLVLASRSVRVRSAATVTTSSGAAGEHSPADRERRRDDRARRAGHVRPLDQQQSGRQPSSRCWRRHPPSARGSSAGFRRLPGCRPRTAGRRGGGIGANRHGMQACMETCTRGCGQQQTAQCARPRT